MEQKLPESQYTKEVNAFFEGHPSSILFKTTMFNISYNWAVYIAYWLKYYFNSNLPQDSLWLIMFLFYTLITKRWPKARLKYKGWRYYLLLSIMLLIVSTPLIMTIKHGPRRLKLCIIEEERSAKLRKK